MAETARNTNLVYVDECGFNLFTRRTRGRALVGQRAVRQVAGSRGQNLNIIMAISLEVGLLYHENVVGTVNATIFDHFLVNLGLVIGHEQNIVLVMDNAPIHRNCAMESVNHTIKYLPPYSPMLNPIENAFSCLKASTQRLLNQRMAEILDRQAAANAGLTLTAYRMRILEDLVEGSVAVITQEKTANWHRHVFGFLPACTAMDDIVM